MKRLTDEQRALRKIERKAYQAKWRRDNAAHLKASKRKYHEDNRELIVARVDAWRKANKDRFLAKANARSRERRSSDFEFRLKSRLRADMWRAIRRGEGRKCQKTLEMLGCTVAEFIAFIERRWLPGMTWKNYGCRRGQWQFDHIYPCASFDLSDPSQQKKCFHFSNYQPLWWVDNIRKRAQDPVVYAAKIGRAA